MKTIIPIAILAAGTGSYCFAQLTPEQKIGDFRNLAGLYAKAYASYEWKRDLFGFDVLDIKPWLDRVARTTDDLDFYEVCVEYIASLNDTHVPFVLPSNFVASLGFTVDIYDGKVLVDSINRARLPSDRYNFQVGDELIAVNDKAVEQWLAELVKYAPSSNERSTRRLTAGRIVSRPQSRMPHAADAGESASVTVRLASGEVRTFIVPWIKTGVPLHVGPVPSPKALTGSVRKLEDGDNGEDEEPWMRELIELQHAEASDLIGVLGIGSRTPVFALPAGFEQRQGGAAGDFFFSGSYIAEGRRIGFVRIPSYAPASMSAALAEFDREIAWFQANTDALVVDNMRNPGGNLCFGESIATRLIPYRFRATAFEIRPTWSRVNGFYNALSSARQANADKWIVDLYEVVFAQLLQAYYENRGRTGSLPLCTPSIDRLPATDAGGQMIAYTKPLVMLIDEFSLSTADSVSSMIQDAARGPLFGWRTNGAGGNNINASPGAYSESSAGVVLALMTRNAVRAIPGYPASQYIENIGVQPDTEYDYMTKDNLLQRGRPFANAFTASMLEEIRRK